MDKFLKPTRQHAKLIHRLLQERLAFEKNSSVGLVGRNNRIAHTEAMIGLVYVLRCHLTQDPAEWWDDGLEDPF